MGVIRKSYSRIKISLTCFITFYVHNLNKVHIHESGIIKNHCIFIMMLYPSNLDCQFYLSTKDMCWPTCWEQAGLFVRVEVGRKITSIALLYLGYISPMNHDYAGVKDLNYAFWGTVESGFLWGWVKLGKFHNCFILDGAVLRLMRQPKELCHRSEGKKSEKKFTRRLGVWA